MSHPREKSPPPSADDPKPADIAPAGLALMAGINAPALEIMRDLNARALAQWTEAHTIWLRFMQRRIARDTELPARLAQCKSPQDLVRIYSEYFQTAAQDYQQEIADVTRLGQAFGNETATMVREKAEEVEKRLSMH